jgi:signal transduction histidine kinase
MGLFLARQLAFQYGGRLTLTNRPGGGALAELEFPLTQIMLPRDAQ